MLASTDRCVVFLVSLLVLAVSCPGQCNGPFTISTTADAVSYNCTLLSGTTWDLEISVTHSGGTADLLVQVDSPASINDLTITVMRSGSALAQVSLDLQGPAGGGLYNLGDLSRLELAAGSDGELIVGFLRMAGDLGYMKCHGIENAVIQGNVVGEIRVLARESATYPRVERVEVWGDFLGDIVGDFSTELAELVVTGDIGTATNPSMITLDAEYSTIGSIDCENLYADIVGSVAIRRVTTQGQWHADLFTRRLLVNTAGGTGNPGIFVGSGPLVGDVYIANQANADISVDGGLPIGSSFRIPNIVLGKSVHFGGDVQGTFGLVVGPLAGSLTIDGDMWSPISIVGDVTETGSIAIDGEMISAVDITGNLAGALTVGSFEESMVRIGDEFSGTLVTEEDGGFEPASVVINANGSSDPGAQLWSGTVSIATSGSPMVLNMEAAQPYQAPFYEVSSSTLGGAVGLVPFMYHAKDSVPDHDTVITTGAFTGTVTVEHYGPVADADTYLTTTPPVKVYRLSLVAPPGQTVPDPATTALCDNRWTDVTSSYTYEVLGRLVRIEGTFANWRAYQIIPNDLVCNIDGTPDVVYAQGWQGTIGCNGLDQTYGYGFQVKTGFDLNQNQMVETGDIETWLIEPADFNGDEAENVIDLSLLIDAVVNGGDE